MTRNIVNCQKQALNQLYQGRYEEAIALYQQCLQTAPDRIDNYWYLGIAYLLAGEQETAEATWMSALFASDDLDRETQNLVNILGTIGADLLREGKLNLAKIIYEQIETITPENIENYQQLAHIYRELADCDRAELILKKIIDSQPNNSSVYLDLANILLKEYRYEEIIELLKIAINKLPQEQNLYLSLVRVLKQYGRAKEAIAFAEEGLKLNPNNLIFQIENARILPILYESESEIEFYRQRFINYLEVIINNLSLETELEKKIALEAISLNSNFYLQYQGKNDLILQKKYGQLVAKIAKANYPNLKCQSLKELCNINSKIKIGLISGHFRDHNGANWALGWVKLLNREKFVVNCYYLENTVDELTKEFQTYSDNFNFCEGDLAAISGRIIEDQIQVLIYTDIGMKPKVTNLASLRLAPIQCVTLGHPITSGLSTIDYYISRTLMEPENGQQYYGEKLFLLPNIGIHVNQPSLPKKPKTRIEFGLDNDSILYLCCQSLFKYLPQFDYIYPAIAQQVPSAKFVFIEFPLSQFVNQQFKRRLQKTFAQYNLNYQDYCLILPRLNEEEYLSLNLIADIFLDSFTWSGDNTTRMAIATNLPVVTCPGEFMRGRHSYGILKMIGVEDTIAYSEGQYIEIAVKLGKNPQWRESIINKIKANQHKLFEDRECIRGLEAFLLDVLVQKLS